MKEGNTVPLWLPVQTDLLSSERTSNEEASACRWSWTYGCWIHGLLHIQQNNHRSRSCREPSRRAQSLPRTEADRRMLQHYAGLSASHRANRQRMRKGDRDDAERISVLYQGTRCAETEGNKILRTQRNRSWSPRRHHGSQRKRNRLQQGRLLQHRAIICNSNYATVQTKAPRTCPGAFSFVGDRGFEPLTSTTSMLRSTN